MINFLLVAVVCEGKEDENKYMEHSPLYKKIQWPVLPRTDEWFEIPEADVGTASPVGDVWHYVSEVDGSPHILVEVLIGMSEYKKLLKSPLWKSSRYHF